MSDLRVFVPSETDEFIRERYQVLSQREEALAQAAALGELAPRIPSAAEAPPIGPLTSDPTPPAELLALLPRLQEELDKIDEAKAGMRRDHDEIAHIMRSARDQATGTIVAAISVLLALAVIAFYLVSHARF